MRTTHFENTKETDTCHGFADYRGIVEHINEGVIIIRDGKIVFANEAFHRISKRDPEQVADSEFMDFVSAADRGAVKKYIDEHLSAEDLPGTIEFVMRKSNGEAIIEMKVSVVTYGGDPAILGALTDITERRKTRLELQRTKERLDSIIDSMHEVVVSLSIKDCSIVAINPAAEALYGIPLREFTSGLMHIVDFIHPDDMEKVERFYLNLPEVEFDEMEYRVLSNDKQIKWVLDEGYVIYSQNGLIRRIDHVIRDITEEKMVIDALKQSEAKYRNFFESTSDMAFTMTPEGGFIDINDAGLKVLGLASREEARASKAEDFFADLSERSELLGEIYEKGKVEGKQLKFKNKTGDVIEVAVTARAKFDKSGHYIYHEGIAHNITKALEDERNRVLRNAAGAMCHYLNTHLMHLLGSKDGVRELLAALVALIEKPAQGESSNETAFRMREITEDMGYFLDGINNAYDRISEVTKAFNKAFHYKEESYVSSTILDIFKAYGYEGDN